jgi:Trk K+ transport system NAD-binding subunit
VNGTSREIVIVVGGDALALRVCAELCARKTHDVRLVWHDSPQHASYAEACGAQFVPGTPDDPVILDFAGIEEAQTVMAIDVDDRVNLDVALSSRELNPDVRLIIGQFNRAMARKIEQNLSNCSVISLASHSAATFAAAAVDPSCFHALEFSAHSGSLVGFSERRAAEFGVAGCTPAEATRRLDCRVVAWNGMLVSEHQRAFDHDDWIVVFGTIERLSEISESGAPGFRRTMALRVQRFFEAIRTMVNELDPLFRFVILGALVIFLVASDFFAFELHLDPISAAYFVVTTMTTVGYGDINLAKSSAFVKLFGMGIMLSGVLVANITIALMSAALVRAQWTALQGLRHIHVRNHIVVCGAGRVGQRVVDYLRPFQIPLVIVESNPTSAIVRLGRRPGIDVLTGDASLDDTLDMCNVEHARAVIVTTDNDTANLEIALGARARQRDVPVVMRVANQRFATLIGRQFQIDRTFSATDLAAPAFAGLAVSAGSRGRCLIGGRAFAIQEWTIDERIDERAIPLCIKIEGKVRCDFGSAETHHAELVLGLLPIEARMEPLPEESPLVG